MGICRVSVVEGEEVRKLRLLVREFFRELVLVFGVEMKVIRVDEVKEL